ncbi:hypothetical protein FDF31_03825 [Clostridium sporogenes]|nr:hypothetical protein [Clostridium sporogenes]NFS24802.1 hypothetical protein [Clostridium sporogenes]
MLNLEYLEILQSKKFSIKEKKLLFIGVLSNTIDDKILFKKNIYLRKYIKIYEDLLKLDEYKAYLYDSRTLLGSRLIRDIVKIEDSVLIRKCIDQHIIFIDNKYKNEIKHKTKDNIKSETNLLIDMVKNRDE